MKGKRASANLCLGLQETMDTQKYSLAWESRNSIQKQHRRRKIIDTMNDYRSHIYDLQIHEVYVLYITIKDSASSKIVPA